MPSDVMIAVMDFDATYLLLALLLIVASCVCWVLNVFMLPGNWMVAGLSGLWVWGMPVETYGRGFGWWAVGVLVGLAVVGEVVEAAAGAAGARKAGSSKRAAALSLVGAGIGSIVGAIFGVPIPVIGPLIAALLGGAFGAFAGAYLGEQWKGRDVKGRIDVGTGAFVGKILGTLGRMAIGAVMVGLVAVLVFRPGAQVAEIVDESKTSEPILPEVIVPADRF
ncbi:DUF456 domain-containing protein [Stratiformator vulcanicus]|uniref:DUF456 domain-containing protein n=1 Tax=Stratiformator vulcanicus TaxID=2527980 RepID=UPI002877B791|nr:DUF456 domain-containing protein [Stratiformator vulcanicus]